VNVLDPQFSVDPWDAYRWLRDEAPVLEDPVDPAEPRIVPATFARTCDRVRTRFTPG
jgi:hypothetical protein